MRKPEVNIFTREDFTRGVQSLQLRDTDVPGVQTRKTRLQSEDIVGLPEELRPHMLQDRVHWLLASRDGQSCWIMISGARSSSPRFSIDSIPHHPLEAKFWEPLDAVLSQRYNPSTVDGRERTLQLARILFSIARNKFS